MPVVLRDNVPVANLATSPIKTRKTGQDSTGRLWGVMQENSTNTLFLYNSVNKFSTITRRSITTINVANGGTFGDPRAVTGEFSLHIAAEDNIMIAWVQDTSHGPFDAGKLYWLSGRINGDDVDWDTARSLHDPGSNSVNVGDVVGFIAPDETSRMFVAVAYSELISGGSKARVRLFKFNQFTGGDWAAHGNEVLHTASVGGKLRPIMTFRQAVINEKTPHATAPHLYLVTADNNDEIRYFFGQYNWSSGNNNPNWSSTAFRTNRQVGGTLNGVATWHTILFDGTNPWWVAQTWVPTSSQPRISINELSATSAAQVGSDYDTGSWAVADGDAYYDEDDDIIRMYGRVNLGTNDIDRVNFVCSSGAFSKTEETFEGDIDTDFPNISAVKGGEWGYYGIFYREATGTDWELKCQLDTTFNNRAPSTPTSLQVDSGPTDTTPGFSCSVSDPDLLEQIKARFTIYESDQSTVVGTVDSSFRQGNGSVSAEYNTILPGGTYYVDAQSIDDGGLSSNKTAKVQFQIQSTASLDTKLRLDIAAFDLLDTTLLVDVESSTLLDTILRLDVAVDDIFDTKLRLNVDTGWRRVDDTPVDSIWTRVVDGSY